LIGVARQILIPVLFKVVVEVIIEVVIVEVVKRIGGGDKPIRRRLAEKRDQIYRPLAWINEQTRTQFNYHHVPRIT
jgi:hypothetical protein